MPARSAQTNRRVAVIGGGPSGLTCAYFLSLMGHDVVIFEARKHLGGMLRYGIPAYRLPRERLDEDINAILAVGGIEVRLETKVGTQAMAELQNEFDAVYVAIGAQKGKGLRIDGAKAEGVISAVDPARPHRRWRLSRFQRQARGRYWRRQRCHGLRAHGGACRRRRGVVRLPSPRSRYDRARRRNRKRHCRRRGNDHARIARFH